MFDFNSLIELKESFAFESYDLYQWESVIDYRFKQFESKTTKKKERKKSNFYHFKIGTIPREYLELNEPLNISTSFPRTTFDVSLLYCHANH